MEQEAEFTKDPQWQVANWDAKIGFTLPDWRYYQAKGTIKYKIVEKPALLIHRCYNGDAAPLTDVLKYLWNEKGYWPVRVEDDNALLVWTESKLPPQGHLDFVRDNGVDNVPLPMLHAYQDIMAGTYRTPVARFIEIGFLEGDRKYWKACNAEYYPDLHSKHLSENMALPEVIEPVGAYTLRQRGGTGPMLDVHSVIVAAVFEYDVAVLVENRYAW